MGSAVGVDGFDSTGPLRLRIHVEHDRCDQTPRRVAGPLYPLMPFLDELPGAVSDAWTKGKHAEALLTEDTFEASESEGACA